MAKDDKNRKNEKNADEENGLVDVFQDDLSDTRRISADELGEIPGDVFDDEDEIEERDYRPIRFRRSGRTGCLGGIMYAVFVISVSIILACFGWMAASDVLALNKDYAVSAVTLPHEIFTEEERDKTDSEGKVIGKQTVNVADIDYVTEQLKNNGLIEYKWLFKLFSKVSHAEVKLAPGTYELSTNLDYRALVKNMQVGTSAMVVTKLTFPEGYTMKQIFEKLEENDICTAEELYKSASDYQYSYSFLENAETGDALRLEGFIFPDTYDFYQGEQPSSVINKFLNTLHMKITADMWKQCENLGISFREAVTIASMIEKEAANDDERAVIASVIYNRIKAGMTLGIDSTILYEFPDFPGGNIPDSILSYDSPYNTRLYTGLPPTPICNPGMASIRAALQPQDTKYYYYALDTETGTHRFFNNHYEFDAFVATQNYDEQG